MKGHSYLHLDANFISRSPEFVAPAPFRDLSSLDDDKCFSGAVINEYAYLSIEKFKAGDSILYVPTNLYYCLLDDKINPHKAFDLIRYLAINKAMTKDIILVAMPATKSDGYWILGVIMLNTKKINILDPLPITNPAYHDAHINLYRITSIVHQLAGLTFQPHEWESFHAVGIPQTYDPHDCGVCVCFYITMIVAKKQMPAGDLDLYEGRSRIRHNLFRVKVVHPQSSDGPWTHESILSLAPSLGDDVFHSIRPPLVIKFFSRIIENSSRPLPVPLNQACADRLCGCFLSSSGHEQTFCCCCRRWFHNFCIQAKVDSVYPICMDCSN